MDVPSAVRIVLGRLSTTAPDMYDKVCQGGRLLIDAHTSAAQLEAASELETYGFVFRRVLSIGYELLPTPFELLLPSLLHRLEWSYPPFIDAAADFRRDLREQLLAVRESDVAFSTFPPDAGFPRALNGTAEIDAFVVRRLANVREVCAISAAEWSGNLPLVWTALKKRLREGMRYRRLVSPHGLVAFGWTINHRDITEAGVDLRVTLAPTPSPFYVFRDASGRAALAFAAPLRGSAHRRATYTDIGELVARLSDTFEDIWSAAVPAQQILTRLQDSRHDYVQRALTACGEVGARVAGMLFDMGIFATLTPADREALPCLASTGLAESSDYTIGVTAYLPTLEDEVARYVTEEGGGSHGRRNV